VPGPSGGSKANARLLAAFGSERERYANAAEVEAYSGIPPVTERSGKKK
jgi:Transposase IS116/IS110/IS902 family